MKHEQTSTAQEIAELEREIAEKTEVLMRLRKSSEAPDPTQREVADLLHSLLCKWNHTDGCGWYYNTDQSAYLDEKNYNQGRYYKLAGKLLKERDADTVLTTLKLILDIR